MGLEVYAFKMVFNFRSRRCVNKFFFLVDNITVVHPYTMAEAVGIDYFSTTDWGFHLLGMITEHANLSSLSVKRIRPAGGAASKAVFREDEFKGRFLGKCTDNFQTANITWTFPNDQTGKHQNRIGPLGEGATQLHDWYPILYLSAQAFAAEHVAVHEPLPGIFSQGCINHQSTGGTIITNAQLPWPPGRQRNRRWKP